MIRVEGVDYLQGPAQVLNMTPRSWKHCGLLVSGKNLYKDVETGSYWVTWQPLDSEWRACARLATRGELLEGWT